MYTQFFRLNQPPFSIAPDPRYLFMSDRHREALAHLLFGVGSGGGFVLLTGEIGAGKTTVCRCFLEQIPSYCNVAYIFNPKQTVTELLKSICDEFRIDFSLEGADPGSAKTYVDVLNQYLLNQHAENKNCVLVIDEAQNLSADVLEQLRLLTNLETSERKLLQIILIGQPELRSMLARPELEQLAQRVIARYHLGSLSAKETAGYIQHRLAIAGLASASPFTQQSMRQIYQLTQGIPRRINLLCDRAMLGAFAENKSMIDHSTVRKAANEVFGHHDLSTQTPPQRWRYMVASLLAGAAIAIIAAWVMTNGSRLKSFAAEAPSSSVAPVPMPITLSSAGAGNSFDSSLRAEDEAYRQLLQLWGVTAMTGEPCLMAPKQNVHCYQSVRGLAEIRQLSRPAVLTLLDDSNTPYYALLVGLTTSDATLQVGGKKQTVSLVALAQKFHGTFATLWRAPQSYRGKIRQGATGEEVDWLAKLLAKINGTKEPSANQPFNHNMVKQIRDFQAAQGLRVDGIVGPRTFIQLNNVAGVDEPRLQASPGVAIAPAGK